MKVIAIVFLAMSLVLPAVAQTSYPKLGYFPDNQIGCGTVISVRKLNQKPMYDIRYVIRARGTTNANEVGSITSGLGVLGPVGSALASVAVGLAIDSSKKQAEPSYEVDESVRFLMVNVRAVQIELDDGKIINLPLSIADSFTGEWRYSKGDRLSLALFRPHGVVQVTPKFIKTDVKGGDDYEKLCSRKVTQEEADAAILKSANLVDESLIIK